MIGDGVTFRTNTARYGGAVYLNGGKPIVGKAIFTENGAQWEIDSETGEFLSL